MSVQQQERSLGQTASTVYDVASKVIGLFPLVGELWAMITHGVTNVKQWENRTGREIEVWKFDHGDPNARKDHYRIRPGHTTHGDMWLPWAENDAEYNGHHAEFTMGGELFAVVWQSAGKVRFDTRNMFMPGGYTVPGAYGGGGNRRVTFVEEPEGVTMIFTKI